MRFLTTLLFFTVSVFSFDYHLVPYSITDGVDCFFGLSSTANKTNGGNIINSCYITTDKGFVVIDSGPSYSYAQQAFHAMQKKKRLPVTHVINSSVDEIHLLGNEFYKERGATLIGPLDYNPNSKIKLSTEIIGNAFRNTRLINLDERIDGDYTLTVGGIDIHIKKAVKNSDKYLLVNIPSKNIIFVGDMLSHNSIPILDNERSLLAWIDSVKKIKDSSWSRIISSNGIRTKRSALNSTRDYLQTLKKLLTKNIKNRVDKNKSIDNIQMKLFKEERLYEEWHKKNIAIAYDELKKIVKPNPIAHKKEIKIKKIVSKKKVAKAKKPKIKKPKREKIPAITTYYSYETAKYYAKQNKKIVMIKVRGNHCPFCDELDSVMQNSRSIRKVVNQNYKMAYLNISIDKLPLGIKVKKIPSLILIRPDMEEVVMTVTDFKNVKELLNMLKIGIQKGKVGGYLK
jgi:glyoxylase-like metal-dependent hydrolase (beta-lactamase superfamily II)